MRGKNDMKTRLSDTDKWCAFANFCLNFKFDYVIIPVMFYFS